MRFSNTYRRESNLWIGRNRTERRELLVQSMFADIDRNLAEERNRSWHTQREIASAIGDAAGVSLETRCRNAAKQFADIEATQSYRLCSDIEEELARRRESQEMRQRNFSMWYGPRHGF
jgi:hypothetical protein